MSDFIPLGELISLQRGTTYKSALLGQPGPVLLGLASIARNGGFRSDSLKTYGGESPSSLLVQPGELYASLKDVTQSADLLGSVARVPIDGPLGRLTQDTVRLDRVSDRVLVDFLYWSLRSPRYRSYCRAHATGTTNLGLPRNDFLAYPLWVPPLSVQQRIVGVLGALDELIDTNEGLIADLRETQQTLYSRAQEAAERELRFGDIAELFKERATGLPDSAYLGLEHFAEDGGGIVAVGRLGDKVSQQYSFERGDVLYGRLRPYFRKVDMPGFAGACTGEIWVLRSRGQLSQTFLYSVVASQAFTDHAMAGSGGTHMPRARWDHMASFNVAIPETEKLREVDALALPMWEQAIALREEADQLRQTRDELLPLLVSGRIRVRELEESVA